MLWSKGNVVLLKTAKGFAVQVDGETVFEAGSLGPALAYFKERTGQ